MTRSVTLKVVAVIVMVLLIAALYLLWPVLSRKVEHRAGQDRPDVQRNCSQRTASRGCNSVRKGGGLPGEIADRLLPLAEWRGDRRRAAQRNFSLCDVHWIGPLPLTKYLPGEAQDDYEAASYLNNRKPGEMYIVGGDSPPLSGAMPPGPFVAKADATTGKGDLAHLSPQCEYFRRVDRQHEPEYPAQRQDRGSVVEPYRAA